mgnify:CR=1 FL=1
MSYNFFIEVGACDMDTCIPLAMNGWKGIIVEPVAIYINNLPKVEGVIYENIGLSGDGSAREITYIDMNHFTRKGFLISDMVGEGNIDSHGYTGDHNELIDDEDLNIALDQWIRGLGTMIRDSVEIRNAVKKYPVLHDYIKTDYVETMTLNDLIEKHDIKEIDFFKMDVEGMEYEIISNYDWSIKPKMMKFEFQHSWGDQFKEIVFNLNSMGYKYWREKTDIYAIR